MGKIDTDVIGKGLDYKGNGVDNRQLVAINRKIRTHRIEEIGVRLRDYMKKNRE